MQERYHIEADNMTTLESRPWSWLARRVLGLLSTDSRIRGELERQRREQDHE